jgi:hypothetical protein
MYAPSLRADAAPYDGNRPGTCRIRRTIMDDRKEQSGKDNGPQYIPSGTDQDSTLLPMLIGGLVMIVIGMVFVMWLT